MSWIVNAGSISGNLLHTQCVSTVFWYPQNDLLIFSDSGSSWKKSRNSSIHLARNVCSSVVDLYLFECCGLPFTYSLVALPKIERNESKCATRLVKWVCIFAIHYIIIVLIIVRRWGHFPRMIEADSAIYYLLLRAKPVYLILYIPNLWSSIACIIRGNLLHSQCASTVFWCPQSDFLIFSDSGN